MKKRIGLLMAVFMLAGFVPGCLAPTPEVMETVVTVEVTRVVEVMSESERCAEGGAIPITQVATLHSSLADRDFTLHIALPPNYSSSDDAYPVVYLLDGGIWTAMASDIGRLLNFVGEVPRSTVRRSFCRGDFILVGIGCERGWTGALLEQQTLRAKDSTDMEPEDPITAEGVGEFLTFVKQSIIPYVDANFRTDPTDRTIAGCSGRGPLAGYVLFPPTETLNSYVATNRSLEWYGKATV